MICNQLVIYLCWMKQNCQSYNLPYILWVFWYIKFLKEQFWHNELVAAIQVWILDLTSKITQSGLINIKIFVSKVKFILIPLNFELVDLSTWQSFNSSLFLQVTFNTVTNDSWEQRINGLALTLDYGVLDYEHYH